ncbi:MAG: hypothetical protein H6745_15130 [Deltaproteobacteria bacterium]|nr:hypothetical protein [Deltaproteobacteria bacterium]
MGDVIPSPPNPPPDKRRYPKSDVERAETRRRDEAQAKKPPGDTRDDAEQLAERALDRVRRPDDHREGEPERLDDGAEAMAERALERTQDPPADGRPRPNPVDRKDLPLGGDEPEKDEVTRVEPLGPPVPAKPDPAC